MWNVLTGYSRNVATNTISAIGVPFYPTSSFHSGIITLKVDAATRHLDILSMRELGTMSSTWLTTTGPLANYWTNIGLNQLALNPVITGSFAATTYYVDTMPVPSSDSDYIQVGEEDLSAIVDYVTFVARLKEGGKEIQDSIPLLQNFLAQATKYNAKLLNNSVYRAVLGYASQAQTRPDSLNSQTAR